MARSGLLAPLRHRDYRRLALSRLVSTAGDWLDFVAVLLLVSTVWRLGAPGLAVAAGVVGLPPLLGPFLGVWLDRWPPRRAMVLADVGRAACTVVLVFAPNLGVLATALFVRGCLSLVFGASEQVALQRCVPRDDLLPANALNQTIVQAMKIAGPALGGVLGATLSVRLVFAVNVVSFLLSALLLAGLRVPEAATRDGARSSYLHELKAGLRLVFRNPQLRATTICLAVVMFVVLMYDAMSPLAVTALGLSSAYVGILLAAVGAGGVLGSLAVGQRGGAVSPMRLIGAGVTVIGVCVALVGLAVVAGWRLPGPAWVAVMLVLGAGSSGVLVGLPYSVQTNAQDGMLARVWVTIGAVPSTLNVVAPAAGAALVGAVGLGELFGGAGVVLVVVGVVVAAAVGRRHRTRATEPEPVGTAP